MCEIGFFPIKISKGCTIPFNLWKGRPAAMQYNYRETTLLSEIFPLQAEGRERPSYIMLYCTELIVIGDLLM